ncbi:unnamed protein product [Scytosiphon promiscuus]
MTDMASSSQQHQEKEHRMNRRTYLSSESFESLTCGASAPLVARLREATNAGVDVDAGALKELGHSVKTAAMEKLAGRDNNCGGRVEVAFGTAMGRSFFATADESDSTADVVLFYTLDPLDIDTKQSTCVRRDSGLPVPAVMQALYKLEPSRSGTIVEESA